MSGRCGGLHCPGCGDGGRGLAAVLVALVVIVAVIHAIWHTIVEAAEIAALTVLGAAALAAIAVIGYAALRVRATMATPRAQVTPKAVIPGQLSADQPPAIEPPRHASWPLPGTWEEIKPGTDRSTS